MAITPTQGIVVGSTATRIDANPSDADRLLIVAQGSGTLVLGGSNAVTTGNGCRVPVVAGTTLTIDMNQGDELWGISSGSITLDVLVAG